MIYVFYLSTLLHLKLLQTFLDSENNLYQESYFQLWVFGDYV